MGEVVNVEVVNVEEVVIVEEVVNIEMASAGVALLMKAVMFAEFVVDFARSLVTMTVDTVVEMYEKSERMGHLIMKRKMRIHMGRTKIWPLLLKRRLKMHASSAGLFHYMIQYDYMAATCCAQSARMTGLRKMTRIGLARLVCLRVFQNEMALMGLGKPTVPLCLGGPVLLSC